MTRAQSHVSTWLSLGDLLLTLGKSYTELDDNYEVLQRPDAHPNLHFVKPTINHAVADFGLDLAGYRLPPILRPSPSLLPECRKEQLRRVHAIPLEERLWCFSVLTAAYVTIKNWVRKSLDDGAVAAGSRVTTKTLAPTVGHLLHIDRLESCEPHRVELPFEHCSDMRLAFNIVVHIHAHSKLAQFFATEGIPKRGPSREEAPVSFQSPDWNIQRDPSTWGFELYSTQAWDETLAEWDGRIEQKILKQSVIVACDEALARIRGGKGHALKTLAAQDHERQSEERMLHLLRSSGVDSDLNSLSIHDTPTNPSLKTAHQRPCGEPAMDPVLLSDKRIMALADRRNDPTTFAHQLDYTPTWAVARGPPASALQASKSATPSMHSDVVPAVLAATEVPDGEETSILHNVSSPVDSVCESSSECSTPRATTPVLKPVMSLNDDPTRLMSEDHSEELLKDRKTTPP